MNDVERFRWNVSTKRHPLSPIGVSFFSFFFFFNARLSLFARNTVVGGKKKRVVFEYWSEVDSVLERCINGNWISALHAVNQLYFKGRRGENRREEHWKKRERDRERERERESKQSLNIYNLTKAVAQTQRVLFDVNHFESNCNVNKNEITRLPYSFHRLNFVFCFR